MTGHASLRIITAHFDSVLMMTCTKGHVPPQMSAVMEFQSQQACTAAAVVNRGPGSQPCCAAGYADGSLRLFDLSTASLAWPAHSHSSSTAISHVEVSPDGRELLTLARSEHAVLLLALHALHIRHSALPFAANKVT